MKKGIGKKGAAFSLVEILAIVLVTAVLTALLFPAVNSMYSRGQSAKCLLNIRTYGSAVQTMAADNGGLKEWDGKGSSTTETGSPQFNKWLTEGGYLDSSRPLRCPLGDSPKMGGVADRYRFPYAGNSSLCQYFPKLTVPGPFSRVVLAAEVNDWDGFTSRTVLNTAIWNGGDPGNEGSTRPMARYHGSPDKRGLHFFFLDGSAQLVFPTDNDWRKEPICAPLTGVVTTGYFYHSTHFSNMKEGTLTAR